MCLLARVPDLTLTGIEADAGLSALAAGNARENGFGASFTAITADLSQPWAALEGLGLRPGMSDHTMANPPFYTLGRTRLAQDARKAMSRAMGEDGLDSWLRFLAACAKPGGSATLIHTADAVGQLMDAFARRFGGLRLIPLYPKAAAPAIRVIMQGIKGSRAPSSILPGIILHEDDGKPTASARAILRQGHGLFGNIPG
jgi:tRNA1(Val) A37 N6-methylase TrmN6